MLRENRYEPQEASPDIVVLDVMMEEFTSGFNVAHDMGIKYPQIPIIMLRVHTRGLAILGGKRSEMAADLQVPGKAGVAEHFM